MVITRAAAASAALLLTLGLAACAGQSDSADTSSKDAAGAQTANLAGDCTATADSFPIKIEHAFGETVITEKPENVATVAWSNHEVPLALGVVPVGMAKATWGDDDKDGVLPWVEDKLTELKADTPKLFDETEGIDFEAVAATKPDVILAAYSGITEEEYERLSKIAPVVAYPDVAWGTTLAEMVCMNADALGLGAEGKALNEHLQKQVDAQMQAHPELAQTSVIFSSLDASDLSKISFYTLHDPRAGFLQEAGMQVPQHVKAESEKTDSFYTDVSAEQADALADVDLFITYGDPETNVLATLQADSLIGKIPAIAAGRVVVLENDSPLAASANPSPLSIDWGLERYFELLSGALKTQ